jgi:hypothetical protein
MRVPESPLRLLAGLAGRLVRHPLTHERIDALTRRVRYPSDRLKELGFAPQADVPHQMVEFWRLDKEQP